MYAIDIYRLYTWYSILQNDAWFYAYQSRRHDWTCRTKCSKSQGSGNLTCQLSAVYDKIHHNGTISWYGTIRTTFAAPKKDRTFSGASWSTPAEHLNDTSSTTAIHCQVLFAVAVLPSPKATRWPIGSNMFQPFFGVTRRPSCQEQSTPQCSRSIPASDCWESKKQTAAFSKSNAKNI